MPVADRKVEGPDTSLVFLGIQLDTEAGELRLPREKLTRLKVAIQQWQQKKIMYKAGATRVQVRIKQSKTDPFRRGVNIYVGRTGADLCPVSAMLDYLNVRGMSAGPLFKFEDGRPLTRQRFVDEVRKGLKLAGINQDKYSGHSFRSGAATTAAARGVEDSIIKTLGRWESLAYLQYVKISRSELAGISIINTVS